MDPLTAAAAAGMRARMESLDMLANNLANSSSAGFKADREFYSLYRAEEAGNALDGDIQGQPLIERHWTDHRQGSIQVTGKPLDLALDGKGFFAVNGPSGVMYTRSGAFQLSRDGIVVSQEGHALRRTDGSVIRARATDTIDFAADGTISLNGQAAGKLQLVDFHDAALTKAGGNYFVSRDSGGAPAHATALVRQRSLEASNVNSAESAIRLVGVMRQFEMLQKAVTINAEMNRKTVEEVAKAG